MAIKNVVASAILALGIWPAMFALSANLDSRRQDFDEKIVKGLDAMRSESNITTRYTMANDLAAGVISLRRVDLDELSCSTVNRLVSEFEAQPSVIKAYIAMMLGEVGGRARAALPALRDFLEGERTRNVPDEFGRYPQVEFVTSYVAAITSIEEDSSAKTCK